MGIILVLVIMNLNVFCPSIKTIEYPTMVDCLWRETRINEMAKTIKEKRKWTGQSRNWESDTYVVKTECITVNEGEEL